MILLIFPILLFYDCTCNCPILTKWRSGNKSAIVRFVRFFPLLESNTVVCVFTSSCNKTPIVWLLQLSDLHLSCMARLKNEKYQAVFFHYTRLTNILLNSLVVVMQITTFGAVFEVNPVLWIPPLRFSSPAHVQEQSIHAFIFPFFAFVCSFAFPTSARVFSVPKEGNW